jgi:2-oxoglutarate dehydrogenase E1 component
MPELASFAESLAFVDELYARFAADPVSVPAEWRALFEGDGFGAGEAAPGDAALAEAVHLARTYRLVNAHRVRGHMAAHLDPLEVQAPTPHPELEPGTYQFGAVDLDALVPTGDFRGAPSTLPLRELMRRLRATYCRTIGVEFHHISDPQRRNWLQDRMEPSLNETPWDRDTRAHMLRRITQAEVLERFIDTKYVGTKRFSVEGGETVIALLDQALENAGRLGVVEVVLGMAHRGRLNTLCHVLGKPAADIFAEFEDVDPESIMGGGDVKYHQGFSSDHTTRAGARIHLTLTPNPSHLEIVDPVVVGRVRAKQHRGKDVDRVKVMGMLMHGDAAFAGQGVVPETLNLYNLRGYKTGGTLHVIINNQIGFTTLAVDSRSTYYCTDLAKMVEAPIFHVNGEDPDAVAHVVRLAMDYRHAFHTDVVIDMYCFRRHGHSETDEAAFTQPQLYRKIAEHPSPRAVYAQKLAAEGVVSAREAEEMFEQYQAELEEALKRAKAATVRPRVAMFRGVWERYRGGPDREAPEVETGVSRERLAEIAARLTALPQGFKLHPKLKRVVEGRGAMGRGEQPFDWAGAEHYAFGSLAWDGTLVRLSGQDCRRGTFSQRHYALMDLETGEDYMPLRNLHAGASAVAIFDSCLSEASVLGFEFGFSMDYPDALVMWEAQFGDFVNGAQMVIDQFISSIEDKWQRTSGLAMLLPHGYEGQGPEHSSARYERFLQLCAEDNMQVCYPSTPAQYFHVLRRQVVRPWRKPLVVLTPKSLLRHKECVSPIEDLAAGRFQRVIADPAAPPAADVRRVVFCAGKIYFDLVEERRRRRDAMTAVVRIEQLYPLREEEIAAAAAPFTGATEWVWTQEEPLNMGAWFFMAPRLQRIAEARPLRAVARAESASPATGSQKAHQIEQRQLMEQTFSPPR